MYINQSNSITPGDNCLPPVKDESSSILGSLRNLISNFPSISHNKSSQTNDSESVPTPLKEFKIRVISHEEIKNAVDPNVPRSMGTSNVLFVAAIVVVIALFIAVIGAFTGVWIVWGYVPALLVITPPLLVAFLITTIISSGERIWRDDERSEANTATYKANACCKKDTVNFVKYVNGSDGNRQLFIEGKLQTLQTGFYGNVLSEQKIVQLTNQKRAIENELELEKFKLSLV